MIVCACGRVRRKRPQTRTEQEQTESGHTDRLLSAHGLNNGISNQSRIALGGWQGTARLLRGKANAVAHTRRHGRAAVGIAANHGLHAIVVALRAIRASRRGGLLLDCDAKTKCVIYERNAIVQSWMSPSQSKRARERYSINRRR